MNPFGIVTASLAAALAPVEGPTASAPCSPVWRLVSSGTETTLLAVAAAPPLGWVAAGENGTVLSSSDATTWQTVLVASGATLRGVAWGDGVLVLVGDGGTVLSGPDPERLQVVQQGLGSRLNAVAWNGRRFWPAGRNLPSCWRACWRPARTGWCGRMSRRTSCCRCTGYGGTPLGFRPWGGTACGRKAPTVASGE